MASVSGMANGTNKPGYISSFMTFLESQDGDDPDDPTPLQKHSDVPREQVDIKEEVDDTEMTFEVSEEGITDKEIKVEVSEEIPTADYIPTDFDVTDGENTYSSEATSTSNSDQRNVGKKGRQKGGTRNERTNQRENLRRTSRKVRRYGNSDAESDDLPDSDPEFDFSDSDDDPDFNPIDKKTSAASDEEEDQPRRGRGKGRGGLTFRGRGRGIKRTLQKDNSFPNKSPKITSPTTTSPPKRRGRPPSYQVVKILPKPATDPAATPAPEGESNTETADQDSTAAATTNERRAPAQLSSAYNYAGGQAQRQNQNIRLPEGPQLTAEQLEMVESQFKSGDFVVVKNDMEMMENPPIWRIDGKSLLQKFQAFEKDGKVLYRNISTYSGWTPQAKALYLGVNVTFVFQSRYDTVVQMLGYKALGEEEEEESTAAAAPAEGSKEDTNKQNWVTIKPQQLDIEISEELRSHMGSFEIYLQTLISQALDTNFLVEIFEENDEYFVERVKLIDELAEQRKKKILKIIEWNNQFKESLDLWPCVNVMLRTTKNLKMCGACSKTPSVKLLQLYGQPYSQQTLRYREALTSESEEKNFSVCDRCSNISQLYSKVSHQKHDYYSQCKTKVTNMRVADVKKATTAILQELLANDHWITKLFRSMCTTWIKVDRLYEQEIKASKKEEETTT